MPLFSVLTLFGVLKDLKHPTKLQLTVFGCVLRFIKNNSILSISWAVKMYKSKFVKSRINLKRSISLSLYNPMFRKTKQVFFNSMSSKTGLQNKAAFM